MRLCINIVQSYFTLDNSTVFPTCHVSSPFTDYNLTFVFTDKPTIDKDQSNSSVKSWNDNEITLTCKWSSSLPAPKWSWYKPDGTDITSSAQNTNQVSKIKVTTSSGDYGLYKCQATNVAGFDEHKINVTQLCKYFKCCNSNIKTHHDRATA